MRPEKPHNSGQWTEARKRSFITSALRRASWPVKYECLKLSYRKHDINPKTGRKCKMHECTECHGLFVAKDVTVDHIVPVVPLGGHDSWDEVIERLFCELDGLQVLCQPCHKVKTAEENATRKQLKKEKQNATKATK